MFLALRGMELIIFPYATFMSLEVLLTSSRPYLVLVYSSQEEREEICIRKTAQRT